MIFKSKIINTNIVKIFSIAKNIVNKMYDEIINISKNIDKSINDIYNKPGKIYIEKKTTIKDGLNFNLHSALLNCTHDNTTSYLNSKKSNNISRQAYESRSTLFGYDELKQINDNLFINNKKNNNNDDKINNNASFCITNTKSNEYNSNYIDGTGINIYDKSDKLKYRKINMLGITNDTNSLLFTDKIKQDNNSEINLFYKLIEQHPFEKNELIVVDKLYFSKKFVNTCNNKNLKFIARIKYNSKALNLFNDYIKNPTKKYNYDPFNYSYNYYGNNIKVISFKSNGEYINLVSNIKKQKKIDFFKSKYGDRWNVEIFFKHIKKNSSIDKITSHNLKTINNVIMSASINQIIIDRILYVYNHFNTNKKKTINVTNFYNLYKSHLMYEIINNKISFDEFYNAIILNVSFYEQKINKELSKERYALMPYTKWHYKHIANITKNKRINKKKDNKDNKDKKDNNG